MGQRLDRIRERLARVAPLKLAIVATLVGIAIGVFALGGATATLTLTNTETFCIGCHEMKDNVYAEYKGTIHDTNRTGVRATCPDCHVPHELVPKLVAKTKASMEVLGHLTGYIDTKEKFEKHRYELASNVWRSMKKTDSRECRNCHTREAMSKDLQSEKAQARHAKGLSEGKTCVDCHFGIAHKEPDGPGPQELDKAAKQAH
jgi:cytochrome c-type protein NapC